MFPKESTDQSWNSWEKFTHQKKKKYFNYQDVLNILNYSPLGWWPCRYLITLQNFRSLGQRTSPCLEHKKYEECPGHGSGGGESRTSVRSSGWVKGRAAWSGIQKWSYKLNWWSTLLTFPSAWPDCRPLISLFLRAYTLENSPFQIFSLLLWDINLGPASCQFYNPGLFFSRTWEPSFWNEIIKRDRGPVSPALWEGRSLTNFSKHQSTNTDDLTTLTTLSPKILQYLSISSPLLKTLWLTVSVELSPISLRYWNSLE